MGKTFKEKKIIIYIIMPSHYGKKKMKKPSTKKKSTGLTSKQKTLPVKLQKAIMKSKKKK